MFTGVERQSLSELVISSIVQNYLLCPFNVTRMGWGAGQMVKS